jgi:hypothetical protein
MSKDFLFPYEVERRKWKPLFLGRNRQMAIFSFSENSLCAQIEMERLAFSP